MLKLPLPKAQGRKCFWKSSKPCHVGIHRIALTEYYQMSTHVPGFQSFFRYFASFWSGQISPSQCWGYLCPKHKDANIFESHLNPVMLVFIEKLSLSTLRWVPICQGFNHFFRYFASFCSGQISPSQCWGYLCPKHKDANIFESHLNPVMLVFIEKLSLRTLRWVPICQGFNHFTGVLHHFVLTKLATSSI